MGSVCVRRISLSVSCRWGNCGDAQPGGDSDPAEPEQIFPISQFSRDTVACTNGTYPALRTRTVGCGVRTIASSDGLKGRVPR